MKLSFPTPQTIFQQFFSDVGHGRIKLSSVAAILIIGTSPLPILAALLIYSMTQFEVGHALDPLAINIFYKVCFIFSSLCLLIGALGLWVKKNQDYSNPLYIYSCASFWCRDILPMLFFLVLSAPLYF